VVTNGEKRRMPRVPIARGGHGRVKAAVPVTVIDVSGNGVLLELAAALRPGSVYDLSAQLDDIALSTQVRITRCRAGSYVPDGKGGRLLLFRAGAEFVEMPSSQAAQLQDWVDRRTTVPLAKAELLEPRT
jgi:hypothetical protein